MHYMKLRGKKGQTLVEYGLIIVLVSVACILGLTTLGQQIFANIQSICDTISIYVTGGPSGG